MPSIAGNIARKVCKRNTEQREIPRIPLLLLPSNQNPQQFTLLVQWMLAAKEVARSINSLLRLSPTDQSSLLDVIEDSFSYPSNSSVHDPEDLSDDEDDDFYDMELESGNKLIPRVTVLYKRE